MVPVAALTVVAVLLVVYAGPIYELARATAEQLAVDAEDFPVLAASGLHDPETLPHTKTITGRPVEEITRSREYLREHYHKPSDEYDPSWNLDGMVDDALLGYWTGLAIANADEMPTWVPGDEFEAARLEALRNVGTD